MKEHKLWVISFTGILVLSVGGAFAEDRVECHAPTFLLSIRDNALSAKIENAPLGEVLKELARQAHLEVYLRGSSAEEKVSARFDNLPLEEGIKRLLKGKDYTLTYDRTMPASSRVAEIRVISNGSGPITKISDEAASVPTAKDPTGERPKSLEEKSIEELVREALQAPDPAARTAALKALVGREEEAKTLPTAVSALRDQDPQVRGAALEVLQGINATTATEPLVEMALKDASPQLRLEALEELVGRSEPQAALDYLKQALEDGDPQIRSRAQDLFQEIAEDEEAATEQ